MGKNDFGDEKTQDVVSRRGFQGMMLERRFFVKKCGGKMTLTDVLFLFATRRCSENKIPPDSVESKRIGEGVLKTYFRRARHLDTDVGTTERARSKFEADRLYEV